MKDSKFTDAQKAFILREGADGMSIAEKVKAVLLELMSSEPLTVPPGPTRAWSMLPPLEGNAMSWKMW